MPARDVFHNAVRVALEKDGWAITNDPLFIEIENFPFHINPETEGMLAAEKGDRKIALEIKSFPGTSKLDDFYEVLGQFIFYNSVLKDQPENVTLYLAVSRDIYNDFLTKEFIQEIVKERGVKQLIVDRNEQNIGSWVNYC
ncbi:MAG: element excision factor XisH family protein [Cyanobacteriota bacterium]|nr:element excision factor XisH family protein [Cyanobacteriota bacterium]